MEARVNGPKPTNELLELWNLSINDTGLILFPNAKAPEALEPARQNLSGLDKGPSS